MLLTNPIWLFALAAVSIPVIIHLWNIKPGKTLKVGSILLFSESSPKSSRSFKLLDILLLILRCLLLCLLAFLLTTPLWQQRLKNGKAKGWILIPQENFSETYHHFKSSVDSLSNKGYEFHYFNKGFAKADLKELLLHPAKDTLLTPPANYWGLTLQLAHRLPPAVNADLFTPNSISHFTGRKPSSTLKLNWHTYPPADSVSTWLAGAWLTTTGEIRVIQGTATPNSTTYQYSNVKNGGQNGSQYSVGMENGVPLVSFNHDKISADTAAFHMAIYIDKYQTDANYLKAALDAIAQLTQRKTIIEISSQADAISGNQDWVFWLSEKPVDNSILQKAKNIFQYEGGKIMDVNDWIKNSEDYTITQGQPKVYLFKTISPTNAAGNPIWTDSFGNPLLSAVPQDKTTIYHFYSRFTPAWNDLVWNDVFPKWLLSLTYSTEKYAVHERRAISNEQLQPTNTNITTADATTSSAANQINITKYLWLVLILALFAERWLATKNNTALTNG